MARLSALDRSVAGKVAVVTGAGSGMGRATAYLFADEGAVVAVADRDGERVNQVAKDIEEARPPGPWTSLIPQPSSPSPTPSPSGMGKSTSSSTTPE
jgi:3-oxoacyl-[acyl-carrier protein] reductase